MKQFKYAMISGTSLLVAMAVAAPAMAQDTPPPVSTGIAAIVVTAQKRAESIQEVPLAVTAMTQEQLDSPTVQDIRDIAAASPAWSSTL